MKIKTQISLLLTTLILVAISATAVALVYQSFTNINQQIVSEVQSFGELSAEPIAELTEEFVDAQSFTAFKPKLTELLAKTSNLANLQIYSYSGELKYDLAVEADSFYQGGPRTEITNDKSELARIQAQLPSFKTVSGEIFYAKVDNGRNIYTDKQGTQLVVQPDFSTLEILDIVVPTLNQYAIRYQISYGARTELMILAAKQIGIIALSVLLASILIGLLFAGTISRPLRKLTGTVQKIAQGDLNQKVDIRSTGEVGVLGTAVNKMTADLQKSLNARIFKEKTEKELELASRIQRALLPKTLPEPENIDISAQLIPAESVSGDVYDFLEVNNDKGHYLYGYLGDVTGHGISASLLSSTANAMIAMLAPEEPNPVTLLSKVNRVLKAKTTGTVFITLILFKYDYKTSKLTYVNAGHEQPFVYRQQEKSLATEAAGGIALGMLPDVNQQLEEREVKLEAGDSLVVYSDGFPEVWKNETTQLGMEGFKKIIESYGKIKSAKELKTAILKDVQDYKGTFAQKDDMTIIIIKRY